ncbi:MAG: hypothetical protein M3Y42_14195 [Actinomycetota bacterium]|nr:hypothetical protein [Actinomycetota bacterium]MDQ2958102.1 hypothetical protein [Actinomycetota bacterium]
MTETVLLTPVRDGEVPTRAWNTLSERRLIDCGDHVEWHDGEGVLSMRLADQPDGGLPVLAGVVRVLVPSPIQQSYAATRLDLIFTGPDGELLARLNTPASRPRVIAEHAFPDGVFDELRARGVTVSEESIKSFREFSRRHPGGEDGLVRGLARRLAYAWT